MKHIVHICEVGRKLKLLDEIASSANDLERTHVSRGKLPFDTKATSTFHWRDAEVDLVSDLESQVTMLAIIVALLVRVRSFEIFTNDFGHFFSLHDQVIAKKLAFTSLGPVERSTTLFSIWNFEGDLAQTCLEAVVVGDLSIRETIFPLPTERDDTSSEHVFEDLVDSLDLATCLRMGRRAEANVGAHGLLEGAPKLGSENASVV